MFVLNAVTLAILFVCQSFVPILAICAGSPSALAQDGYAQDVEADVAGKNRAPAIRFRDVGSSVGIDYFTYTFGIAVSSFSTIPQQSGRSKVEAFLDDIIISNHGLAPPSLFLNTGGKFINASYAIPDSVIGDIHGIFAGDVDGDRRRDLVIAGGGANGVGTGQRG
jgi:hypothetical protein